MADTKISDLAAASSVASANQIAIVQGGSSKRATFAQLFAGTSIVDEVPSGAINGSNKTFVLAHTPLAGSLAVYVNGIRWKVTTDFTLAGATITTVAAAALMSGDTIWCDYWY